MDTFGLLIEIDHGNGVVTRYAHNTKLLVKVNDIVESGQQIAEAGRTGRATGYHCHFEVLINGQRENPANYLPKPVKK
jgi:murein DD-endopeptidase MepM/ murein hydrolase activator NlpD